MWFSSAWTLLPSTTHSSVINFPSVRNALRKPAKRLWQSLRIWRFCLRSLGSTWLHLLLIHWLVLDYNKLTQYPSQRVSGNPHYLHFRRSFLLRLLRTSILTSPLWWSAPPSSPSSSCAHWKQVSNLPSYLYMYFLFRIPHSTMHLFFRHRNPEVTTVVHHLSDVVGVGPSEPRPPRRPNKETTKIWATAQASIHLHCLIQAHWTLTRDGPTVIRTARSLKSICLPLPLRGRRDACDLVGSRTRG